MRTEEIESYIAMGSRSLVCIYREQLESLHLLVISFYIMGKPDAYVLSVEFDPIDKVDDGEGWIWHSEPMAIDRLKNCLEKHLNVDADDWENITKSGKLSFFDDDIDSELYQKQELFFTGKFQLGKPLLPKDVVWVKRPDL